MLINATHADEIRVAIADGQKLYDLDIDSAGHYRKKGNIYKAKITRIEPSLEACFVNYGSERHGFLPYKEISPAYCKQSPKGQPRLPINKALNEGDEIIVQVNKEERGNKGAALSTYISLAGRYLVYMPNNSRAGGVSRQIRGEERNQLQQHLKRLNIPNEDGIIVRTAGLGRTFEELQWDFNYLQQVWEAIQKTADQKRAPFFIYQESDLFIRALRDYLQPSIGEILIDDRASYEKAREFMQQVMPHNLKKLSYYNDTTPLFSRYQIERQIQSAFEREVKLPSGGSLVIDHTEALLSIDINSAKATKGADVETTALNTNLEAADEIARQLRIRDLGGLVVIDFIDMRQHKNQRQVENRLRDAVTIDRARVQIGRISKFGLLEMSRQRLRSSIADSSQITCPTCAGYGTIRSMDSLIISIIRLTEEEMIKPKTGRVIIQVPVEISNKLLNEKREELTDLEQRHRVQLNVISNENLNSPNFHVQRLNVSESNIDINKIKLVEPADCQKPMDLDPPAPQREQAALQMVKPNKQAPKRSVALLVSSWFKALFAGSENRKKKTKTSPNTHKQANPHKKGQRKSANPKSTQQKQNNRKPAAKKQDNQNQSNPKQTNKPSNQKQANQNQANQKPANQKPANQKPAKQKQANQKQTKQQQTNNKQSNQKQAGQKPSNRKSIDSTQNKPKQTQNNNPEPAQNKSRQSQTPNKQSKPAATKKSESAAVKNKPKTGGDQQEATKNKQSAPVSPDTADKMKRPLGSVADLVAKKEPIVPSGAQIKKDKARQESDAKTNNKSENKKNRQPKTVSNQNQDSKAQGSKAQDSKAQDSKAQDSKAQDSKAQDSKAQDSKAQDAKAQDSKAQDSKAQESKAQDAKAQDAKAQDAKAQDSKAQDSKAQDSKAQDSKAQDSKAQDSKAQDSKAQDAKAQDAKAQDKQSQATQSQSESSQRKQNQSNST
ncbi:Rne/Rng family ribonuclease [Marinicella pacifica]